MPGKGRPFQKGHIYLGKKGKHWKLSEETKRKMSLAKIGKHSTHTHTEETKKKISKAKIGKIAEWRRGEKSNFWKGGITPINKTIRHSIEFRLWREAVFARDNWTCQKCKKRGGRLHSHHIKSFANFPELRFAIDNGQTLCRECHKKIHNYKINKN